MERYIKQNIIPIMIGAAIAFFTSKIIDSICDTIIKIHLIE